MIYFIATKHDAYRQREFWLGDVVIDPFRYIPDSEGVRIKRLGRNQPELISILVPSRGRPEAFREMLLSAARTATFLKRVEVVVYLDENDPRLAEYEKRGCRQVVGPQILLSEAWNRCYEEAQGEILMHCGDDIRFLTPGWDQIVRKAFREVSDRIVLVHGDDLSPNTDALATHGFVHRRWVETVGYFLPPYFSCDWNDVWLTEVADMIGRRVKVPIVTDHLHYTFGRRERDQTDAEREERGARDGVVDIYERTRDDRASDAAKLQAVMA